MKKELLDKLSKALNSPKKIVIIPHKNPDGDALGSCLALHLFLTKMGHHSQVISPNDYPQFLEWLPSQANVEKYTQNPDLCSLAIDQAELIFTLDHNQLDRIDGLAPWVGKSAATKIMIDHHQDPGDYASITFSDPNTGSTCEMVFEIMARLNPQNIDKDIASCLYTGIMTDSGSFRFPSTTSRTHEIVSQLIEFGAQPSSIHQNIYDTFTFDRMQLLGTALRNLKKIDHLPVVYITLSQQELNQNHFKKGDTEGFVNYGLSLKGIVLAVIMIENESENIIKISFRSKGNFDVNKFARKYFGGGGHINAAGGISKLSMEKTVAHFLEAIDQIKAQLDA